MFTSLFFSLEVPLFHFFSPFFAIPCSLARGLFALMKGLSDAVVLCTQLRSLALVPDLTAVLLKNRVVSWNERSKNTIFQFFR